MAVIPTSRRWYDANMLWELDFGGPGSPPPISWQLDEDKQTLVKVFLFKPTVLTHCHWRNDLACLCRCFKEHISSVWPLFSLNQETGHFMAAGASISWKPLRTPIFALLPEHREREDVERACTLFGLPNPFLAPGHPLNIIDLTDGAEPTPPTTSSSPPNSPPEAEEEYIPETDSESESEAERDYSQEVPPTELVRY